MWEQGLLLEGGRPTPVNAVQSLWRVWRRGQSNLCLRSGTKLLNHTSSMVAWKRATNCIFELMCHCRRKPWATVGRVELKDRWRYSRWWKSRRQKPLPERRNVNCLCQAGQILFPQVVLRKEGGYLWKRSWWRLLCCRLLRVQLTLLSTKMVFLHDMQTECDDGVKGNFRVETALWARAPLDESRSTISWVVFPSCNPLQERSSSIWWTVGGGWRIVHAFWRARAGSQTPVLLWCRWGESLCIHWWAWKDAYPDSSFKNIFTKWGRVVGPWSILDTSAGADQ